MRKAGIALGLVVLLAAGWSGLWLWAAREAGRQTDAWLAAEAAQGRAWTCPNRAIGGYPAAITVSCSDATFASQAMGEGVEAQVSHLAAGTALWHPRRIAVTLTPPLSYRTSDGSTNLQATWADLVVDLDGLPNIDALALRGRKIAVAGTFGDQGRQAGSAARLDTRFTLVGDAKNPARNPMVDFAIAVDGAPMAPLDALVGGAAAPIDVALAGTLDRADVGDARTPNEAIEHWRQAGGGIALDQAKITRDGAKVTATGTLSLDESHRPSGKLDAQFTGLGPILARYGINGNMAAAGALLSALFGGPKPAAPTEPGALALPIVLRNGRLAVGPISTGIELPPLY